MNRIKVIVPVSSNMWNVPVKQLMDRYKNPDTEIQVVNLAKGPDSIECAYDEVMAEMFALEEAEKAQEEGFDGVIIYCGTDPGVRAAKEKLDIPVVGIGETSYHLASLLGSSFSIITVAPSSLLSTRRRLVCDHLKLYGLEHKCSSVRTVDIPVIDLQKDKATQAERVFAEAKKAIEEDGADTIVLGCGGLLGVGEQISNELEVPVIVPGIAALKISESLIQIGLKQSKRCFGTPTRQKKRI
ncbi:MAG TPA: aspartate/glutamate racemase family protein [Candidatus Heimdallarchaeota archaeon]|nr:aspartate/glutamate racemase family protein [Candidatus Heimdallarchaeota archaeon]